MEIEVKSNARLSPDRQKLVAALLGYRAPLAATAAGIPGQLLFESEM